MKQRESLDCYCFTFANKAEKTCVLMDAFFSPLSLFSQRVVIKKNIWKKNIKNVLPSWRPDTQLRPEIYVIFSGTHQAEFRNTFTKNPTERDARVNLILSRK
jgi:hypothetical protein